MTSALSFTGPLGKPTSRVDGPLKVTGQAKYAGEFKAPGLLFGVVVSSAIARGRITSMDTKAAEAVPGVVKVFTHLNRPHAAFFNFSYKDDDAPKGTHFKPLYDANVLYSGQPIALVVAESFEAARYASSLVHAGYQEEGHNTVLARAEKRFHPGKEKDGFEPPPKGRGDAQAAFSAAPVRVSPRYISAMEHHNPMEMHASTVVYDEGKYTIFDKIQGVLNSQKYVCGVFNLLPKDVRVKSPFVGGAFGSGLRPQYQLYLAVMAAKDLQRSVRVTLTRQQMFTFGHRPETHQEFQLGAAEDGTLQAVSHHAFSETSQFENYVEVVVNWSGSLYQCDNVDMRHTVGRIDVFTPLDMRAPGAAHGVTGLEMAIDELAYALKMDPLALRSKNYAERDQNKGNPFSSKELHACYQQGAERFGWSKRTGEPRSMRDKNELIGWGVATGAWEAQQQQAAAKASINLAGKLTVSSATADIGCGTYTIMAQVGAETMGLPLEEVTAHLGDTELPEAPLEGGSWTAGSVGSAVKSACNALKEKLLQHAQQVPGSSFANARISQVSFADGRMALVGDPSKWIELRTILQYAALEHLDAVVKLSPDTERQEKFTRLTHSAVFVEVKVDEDLGTVRVTRVVSAIAGGRILNPKTARSQILGGVVWGISMALHEESLTDHHLGRIMNHNLSEYHVPTNADIHDIDVIFVEEVDSIVNPLGAKGLGEIGIVGTAAAVANAIYHATGKRVRELPITIDKLV